ncbi:hypothetical protein BC941DRAFT_439152 [Chlamydoabsidia padenii]|nr:hypothetical protein BC941DRAFT_439152 [Chlamydoabsidia padenii]
MSQNSYECYKDVFLTAHPKDGLHTAQEKQRQGLVLDEELAQYFKERAHIEDQYAKSLVKASKRLYVMDSTTLGGLAPIWELLVNELTEISNVHGVLAYRIMDEIEKVLKTPASTDVEKIKSLEPTFHQLSKSYEAGFKTKKSGKSSLFKSTPKVQSDKILSQWTKEGPALLQLYENVERARLQRLKSLVKTFEQIHKDQFDHRTQIANTTLSAADTFDVDNDILQFCKSKKNHLTAAIVSTTATSSTPSIHTIDPSDQESTTTKDSPRQMNEKKQRSRFSILRKSKKPSTSKLKRDSHSISSIPEHSEQQPNQFVDIDNISEAVPNSSHSRNVEQHQDVRTGFNPIQSPIPPSPSPSSGFNNASATTINSNINQAPPVDEEGYSIPFPDTFGQTTSTDGEMIMDDSTADLDSSHFGSQKLKFNIKDQTMPGDNQQIEQEKATLTRISSLLRENTPTTPSKRRGRRTNMRIQSNYWEAGPPSPLSSINELGSSINVGSTISSTSSNDNVTNPFRQSTMPNDHRHIRTDSPSPISSHDQIPVNASHQSRSSSSSSLTSHQHTLLASIVETVNVSQHGITNAEITGHIKMAYDGPILPSDTVFMIRLYHVQDIQPAHSLVQPTTDDASLFAVSVRAFANQENKFIHLFSYRQQEKTLDKVLPLVAETAWKNLDTSTLLMVKYRLTNRMATIPTHGQLRIMADPGHSDIIKVQSTPEGLWDQQQQIFTWNASEIIAHQQGTQQQAPRLLAKFIKGNNNDNSSPSLSLKYYCRDELVSGIELASWIDHDSDKVPVVQTQVNQRMTKSGTILLG